MRRRLTRRSGQSIIEFVLVMLAVIAAVIVVKDNFMDSLKDIGTGADNAVTSKLVALKAMDTDRGPK